MWMAVLPKASSVGSGGLIRHCGVLPAREQNLMEKAATLSLPWRISGRLLPPRQKDHDQTWMKFQSAVSESHMIWDREPIKGSACDSVVPVFPVDKHDPRILCGETWTPEKISGTKIPCICLILHHSIRGVVALVVRAHWACVLGELQRREKLAELGFMWD